MNKEYEGYLAYRKASKPVLKDLEPVYSDFLIHHGIKGQKWGIRRYQNEDGTLTTEGRKQYDKLTERQKHQYDRLPQHWKNVVDKQMARGKSYTNSMKDMAKRRRTAALVTAVGATALASAGAYAIGYFGTKGLTKVGMKAAKAVSQKMKTSQGWHNLMNRVKAMKTGDIVLRKKDYWISGDPFLNAPRR